MSYLPSVEFPRPRLFLEGFVGFSVFEVGLQEVFMGIAGMDSRRVIGSTSELPDHFKGDSVVKSEIVPDHVLDVHECRPAVALVAPEHLWIQLEVFDDELHKVLWSRVCRGRRFDRGVPGGANGL